MALLGGWLCEVIIPIPYSPLLLKNYFTPIKGGGGMAPCALSYASDGGAARICQRGVKARERSDRAGGGCHGREIFQNLCLKTAFSCTLDTIIRGSLCTGIDQFPTLFLLSFFVSDGVSEPIITSLRYVIYRRLSSAQNAENPRSVGRSGDEL